MTTRPKAEAPGPEASDWTLPALDSSLVVANLPGAEQENLDRLWSRCQSMPPSPRVGQRIDAGQVTDWSRFQERLVYEATAEFISSGQGTHLMFHAAGLSDIETGDSIALIAASGTGKTTATRELGRVLGYITDETVAVASDFTIAPYPKPLSVLPAHGRRPKIQMSPDDLGLLPLSATPSLTRMAILNRVPSSALVGSEPTFRVLPLREAIERIVPQTSSLSRLPRGLATLCSTIQRCGGALEITYSEARTLPPLIAEIMQNDGETLLQEWKQVELTPVATVSHQVPLAQYDQAWLRSVAQDAVIIDDVLVVLSGDRLNCITGIAAIIWEELSCWRTTDQLHDRLVSRVGSAPNSQSQLGAVLNNMLELGILANPAPELHESH